MCQEISGRRSSSVVFVINLQGRRRRRAVDCLAVATTVSAAEAFLTSLRGKLRDPELRFFTTFELAQSIQLRKILRLIWRSRRLQTVLYEIIRNGDAAERLAGGRFFRFCQ